MRKIIMLSAIVFFSFACEEKKDVFESSNEKPQIQIRTNQSEAEYGPSLYDSLYLKEKEVYEAVINVKDDQYLSATTINTTFTEGNGKVEIKDSIFYFTPETKGIVKFNLIAMDPYGLTANVEIELYVFDNYKPVPKVTIKKLETKQYQVNASRSYDPDGTIVNYHFDYGITTIDWDEPIVEIWAAHIEDNGGVTIVLTDDKGLSSDPVFFELE